jgi:hypothetical protein
LCDERLFGGWGIGKMAEGESSFLLRTLAGSAKGANTKAKPTQIGKITQLVTDTKAYSGSVRLASFLWQWGGSISWVVVTTVLVLVFPLSLELGKELELGRLEQEIMLGYQAKGYPPHQLQAMQAQGQFGIPPMPPPAQPQFE